MLHKRKQNLHLLYGVTLLAICLQSCKPQSNMPSFSFLLVDSTTIKTTKDIPNGQRTVFIYFSPYCQHCQNEITNIVANMDSLQAINFYLLTNDPLSQLRDFNGYFKIFKYKNITLGEDYSFYFLSHFKKIAPPFTMIFDSHKRLRYVFRGEMNARQLIFLINEI